MIKYLRCVLVGLVMLLLGSCSVFGGDGLSESEKEILKPRYGFRPINKNIQTYCQGMVTYDELRHFLSGKYVIYYDPGNRDGLTDTDCIIDWRGSFGLSIRSVDHQSPKRLLEKLRPERVYQIMSFAPDSYAVSGPENSPDYRYISSSARLDDSTELSVALEVPSADQAAVDAHLAWTLKIVARARKLFNIPAPTTKLNLPPGPWPAGVSPGSSQTPSSQTPSSPTKPSAASASTPNTSAPSNITP